MTKYWKYHRVTQHWTCKVWVGEISEQLFLFNFFWIYSKINVYFAWDIWGSFTYLDHWWKNLHIRKKKGIWFQFYMFYFGQCREKSVAPLAFLPQSYHCIFDESLLHLRNISCEKMEFIEKERNNLLEFSPTTAEAENNCISAEQSVSLKIRLSHCTGIRITSPP